VEVWRAWNVLKAEPIFGTKFGQFKIQILFFLYFPVFSLFLLSSLPICCPQFLGTWNSQMPIHSAAAVTHSAAGSPRLRLVFKCQSHTQQLYYVHKNNIDRQQTAHLNISNSHRRASIFSIMRHLLKEKGFILANLLSLSNTFMVNKTKCPLFMSKIYLRRPILWFIRPEKMKGPLTLTLIPNSPRNYCK